MRKRIISGMIGVALLPGLSCCAADMNSPDAIAGGAVLLAAIPVIIVGGVVYETYDTFVDPFVEIRREIKKGVQPSETAMWKKKGVSGGETYTAAIQCGYTGYALLIKTAADAEEMVQRAACMEQAGFQYVYSSKGKLREFSIGGTQELSYAGICRNYAQYHLPACRKGTKLRTIAERMQKYYSFCAAEKADDYNPACFQVRYCKTSEYRYGDSCTPGSNEFKKGEEKDLKEFNESCLDRDKKGRLKPECRP